MIRLHESPTGIIDSRRNKRTLDRNEASTDQLNCAAILLNGTHGTAARLGATIVLFVLALLAGSCGQDGVEGPGDVDIPDRAIGLLPADWGEYSMFDVGRILDDDTASYAGEFEDSWGDTLDQAGILIDEVSILAIATGEGSERVTVLQGSFELEAIRDDLSDSSMEEGEYRGFELWEGDGYPLASEVVLIEDGGFVLLGGGHARAVLRGLSRGAGLLEYEDESGVLDLLERAGDGWNMQVWIGRDCLSIGVQRCEGVAWSVTPAGGDDAEVTWAFAFRDERSARMEMDDVEEVFEDIDELDVHDVVSDGRLVVVSGILEEHDWRRDGQAWASGNLAQSASPSPASPTSPTPAPAMPAPWPAPTQAPAASAAPTVPTPAPAAPLPVTVAAREAPPATPTAAPAWPAPVPASKPAAVMPATPLAETAPTDLTATEIERRNREAMSAVGSYNLKGHMRRSERLHSTQLTGRYLGPDTLWLEVSARKGNLNRVAGERMGDVEEQELRWDGVESIMDRDGAHVRYVEFDADSSGWKSASENAARSDWYWVSYSRWPKDRPDVFTDPSGVIARFMPHLVTGVPPGVEWDAFEDLPGEVRIVSLQEIESSSVYQGAEIERFHDREDFYLLEKRWPIARHPNGVSPDIESMLTYIDRSTFRTAMIIVNAPYYDELDVLRLYLFDYDATDVDPIEPPPEVKVFDRSQHDELD